jgi:hypothetical protein
VKSFFRPSAIKASVLFHVSHVQSFMQLLMKSRNGVPWSPEEKIKLRLHLKHIARTLPVLGLFALPGGSLLIPTLAWFLDRRKDRSRRLGDTTMATGPAAPKASHHLGTE